MPLLSCLQQQLQQQRTFKQIVNKNLVISGVKACDKSSRCPKLKVVRSVVYLVSISLWLFLFVSFVPGLSIFNTASCCVSIETPHLKRGANKRCPTLHCYLDCDWTTISPVRFQYLNCIVFVLSKPQ